MRILVECLVFSVRQASTSELLGRWPKGEKQGDEVKQVRFCAPLTKTFMEIHGKFVAIRVKKKFSSGGAFCVRKGKHSACRLARAQRLAFCGLLFPSASELRFCAFCVRPKESV